MSAEESETPVRLAVPTVGASFFAVAFLYLDGTNRRPPFVVTVAAVVLCWVALSRLHTIWA